MEVCTFEMDESEKQRLKKIADAEDRTIGAQIRVLLVNAMDVYEKKVRRKTDK